MDEIQQNIFRKALDYRNSMITKVDTWDEFVDVLENKGGFISAHWDGTVETEVAIKDATKATIRCIPMDAVEEEGKCVFSGKPSHRRVLSPAATKRCRYRIITTKTDAIQRSVRLRFCRKQVMNYQNDSVRRQDRLLDQPEATELLRRGEYGILCMQRPEGGGYGVPLNYVWDEATRSTSTVPRKDASCTASGNATASLSASSAKRRCCPHGLRPSTKASCSTAGPARGSQRRSVGGP